VSKSSAELLRYYAERVKVCWEGSDADEAIAALLAAADQLEVHELLARAGESKTVWRKRRKRD